MRTSPRRGRSTAVAVAALALTVAACDGGHPGSAAPTSTAAAPGSAAARPTAADVITPVTAQDVACPAGTPGKGKPAVRFGSKDGAEQSTLGEVYTRALTSRGYTATHQANVGGTEVIDDAFRSGRIDAYAESPGEIETSIAKQPVGSSPEDVYIAAKTFEEQQRSASLTRQTPFRDAVAPVVRQSVLDAQGPGFAQTLDCVSSLLTTGAVQALTKEVQVNKGDPGAVAAAFLDANRVVPA